MAPKQILSKTQKVSEQIKTDIIPFLDNDIDDLDNEVEMISKKSHGDEICPDDIKLNFDPYARDDRGGGDAGGLFGIKVDEGRMNRMSQNLHEVDEEEESKTRNFNTMPRNYSDTQKKQQEPH